MKITSALLMVVLLVACTSCKRPAAEDPGREVNSIDREHIPNATPDDGNDTTTNVPASDESVSLPFKPPISMDPVDGSKVSIRADTPTTEYENKIYHFSSQENLKLFLESPAKYAKGALSTY